MRSSGPPATVLENIVGGSSNQHIATSHQDTTEGAVHCFQDEYGMHEIKTCTDTILFLRKYSNGDKIVKIWLFLLLNCPFQEIGLHILLEKTVQEQHWAFFQWI